MDLGLRHSFQQPKYGTTEQHVTYEKGFNFQGVLCVKKVFLNCRAECPASNGQAPLNDVHIINLSLVSDVQVKKEVNTVPEPPQSLDFCRVSMMSSCKL